MSSHTPTTPVTPFYRIRWVLRMTKESRLHAHQGGIVYALLAHANQPPGDPPSFPDGFLPDVPEQCRVLVRPGEQFALGGTLLESSPSAAGARLEALTAGLKRIGKQPMKKADVLGGNFELETIEDLAAGQTVTFPHAWTPIPLSQLDAEVARVLPQNFLTLRFTSPLRIDRPSADRHPGSAYLDGNWFDPLVFLKRLLGRLPQIGIRRKDGAADTPPQAVGPVELLENHLVWIDLGYGRPGERKRLGGAVGRLRLRLADPTLKAALVWGQYARVGRNPNFGFGAYRIVEAGPDPFPCRRGMTLLETAFRPLAIDRRAQEAELEGGELRLAAERVLRGEYTPALPIRFLLAPSGGPIREMAVPQTLDRALQRLVLDEIAAGLDRLFEESSFAWRKGLGRASAARHIADVYRFGFRFAVRADLDRFFDSVDLALLEERLRAYLNDDGLADLILTWVRGGRPNPTHGLPTGAPLSPLLGNLLLDQFDHQIAAAGGRLVRYADDFLILTRTREEADRLYRVAAELAAALHLRLNEDPAPILDLREPFDFLGFRFERHQGWEPRGRQGPKRIDQLGWKDAHLQPQATLLLPGETDPDHPPASSVVLGPEAWELAVADGRLFGRRAGAAEAVPLPAEPETTLITLGRLTLSGEAVEWVLSQGLAIWFADPLARSLGVLAADPPEDPEVLLAQARAATDPARTLTVARALVAAKLNNYAALADAAPERHNPPGLAHELRAAILHATQAATLAELRGVEGAAAARWYGRFSLRLGQGFSLEGRQAPDAEDPVNVLLNIAQTHLYRWCLLAARAAGLAPTLGLFHAPNRRYGALAADLQEPFRHLMDRSVIEATRILKPGQFKKADSGPFRLVLAPDAARLFQALLVRILARGCSGLGQDEPITYREQVVRTARSLRRHLVQPETPFAPFIHP